MNRWRLTVIRSEFKIASCSISIALLDISDSNKLKTATLALLHYFLFFRKGSKGKHLAVDVVCRDGSEVRAPFSGIITKVRGDFHIGINVDGVQIRGEGKQHYPTFQALVKNEYHLSF